MAPHQPGSITRRYLRILMLTISALCLILLGAPAMASDTVGTSSSKPLISPGSQPGQAQARPRIRVGNPTQELAKASSPDSPISLQVDDGTRENEVGFPDGSTSYAAIWLNRFTPAAGSYPISLQSISVLWPSNSTGTLVGKQVKLLVYQDADGDGNPLNASLVGQQAVTIQSLETFVSYTVNINLPGPGGDVYIGFEDTWAESGYSPGLFSAAIDTTQSQQRSWIIAQSSLNPPDINNLGNNDTADLVDSFGLPGNWMIRASGQTVGSTCNSNYTIHQSIPFAIVSGTTDIGNHCDDCTTDVNLPFAFRLYDRTFTVATISSNGDVQFLSYDDMDYNNVCLPNPTFDYAIMPHWDDLRTDGTGHGIFTSISGSAPNRIFNIEWRTTYYGSTGTANFELRLYENSPTQQFDVIYGQLDQNGSSATAGVQKDTGSLHYSLACNWTISQGLKTAYNLTTCNPSPTVTPIPTATGNALTISSITLQQPKYPTGAWDLVVGSNTFDGNLVRISANVRNTGSSEANVRLWFWDNESNYALPDRTHTSAGYLETRVPAGGSSLVQYQWDTLGFAWNNDGTPHNAHTIRVDLETLDSTPLDSATHSVYVAPKPLVLVHGWTGSADGWSSYQGYLNAVRPGGDWHAYAVGDGQEPGVMDMGTKSNPFHGTNDIAENALVLHDYVDHLRQDLNAWHIDLVAHSMGGLVSRQYIQVAMPSIPTNIDTRPVVSHLIMLGTPNMGSPCADLIALNGQLAPYAPATYELTTRSVTRYFNPNTMDKRGVPFSILAGTLIPRTCQDSERGDTVVPQSSAEASFIYDKAETNSIHTSLTSQGDFNTFVKPRLSHGPQAARAEAAEAAAERPQLAPANSPEEVTEEVVYAGVSTIPAGGSIDVPISVPSGSAFGATMPGLSSVTVSLRDPSGNTVDTISPASSTGLQAVWTLRSPAAPAPGTWKVHATNSGAAANLALSAWVTGNPLTLDLQSSTPGADGRVTLVATMRNGASPAVGASMMAYVQPAGGSILSLALLDDGRHGDGAAGDGVYAGTTGQLATGIYSVTAHATYSGQVRVAGDVVQVTRVCQVTFTDVHPSDYFYTAVQYLACGGIISGYADNTFRPFANTTRGQLAKIVVGAEGWSINTTGGPHFIDVPTTNPFYTYIETAYNHGAISGYTDNTFRWGNNVTRGQLCKIIVLSRGWSTNTTGGPHFADVPTTNPFYTYIETTYNHGAISGYSDGTFRWGNNAIRAQISKIVYNAITGGAP